jgi:hypothetical protein
MSALLRPGPVSTACFLIACSALATGCEQKYKDTAQGKQSEGGVIYKKEVEMLNKSKDMGAEMSQKVDDAVKKSEDAAK